MKHVLSFALVSCMAALPPLATAAEGDDAWVEISNTQDDIFSVKKGSFEISKTKGGKPIGVVRGQTYDKAEKKYEYQQWYVSQADCLNGMGKLVILDTAGEFKFETDFVSEGKSVASTIGDLICALHQQTLKEQQSKGI